MRHISVYAVPAPGARPASFFALYVMNNAFFRGNVSSYLFVIEVMTAWGSPIPIAW
ncbi:MAG: hypothetical protein ACE5IO_09320 [Thermoplasmata archaeon]